MFSDKTPSTATKMLTISEVSPISARQGLALAGPGAPLGPFFEYVIFSKNFFCVKYSIFEYCKREYLTLGSLFFTIFEPWIWRRLGSVPACFLSEPPNDVNKHLFSDSVTQIVKEGSKRRSLIKRVNGL